MVLLQSFPLQGLRLCFSPPGPNIASVSTIGFSRREVYASLLPKSLSHPRSGTPSILSCLKISRFSWFYVSCPSHELGPLAPFHTDRPRPSRLDMSRFIRDCDPRLIRHRSRDRHHSKGNTVALHYVVRLLPLPLRSKFVSLAIFPLPSGQ